MGVYFLIYIEMSYNWKPNLLWTTEKVKLQKVGSKLKKKPQNLKKILYIGKELAIRKVSVSG